MSEKKKSTLEDATIIVGHLLVPVRVSRCDVLSEVLTPEVGLGAHEEDLGVEHALPELLEPDVLHVVEGDEVDAGEADDEAMRPVVVELPDAVVALLARCVPELELDILSKGKHFVGHSIRNKTEIVTN